MNPYILILAFNLAAASMQPVHQQPPAAHLVCTTRQPAPMSLRDLWNWLFVSHTRKRWLNAPVS